MKIACVGGGPAGLYFASLAKLGNPAADITVYERNPAGVTYGWGVSYSFLLAQLQVKDPVSARQIRAASVMWRDQEVFLRDRPPVHLGGYGFNIGRKVLLDILTARAQELGVRIESEQDITDLSQVGDVDLLVACDGQRSRIRTKHADQFGTSVEAGRNKYIWLGTKQRFDAFGYGFEETRAGWIWFYGYNFSPDTATFIVECCASTWQGLGFDQMGPKECTDELERIFARHLGGHALVNQSSGRTTSRWLEFLGIRNDTWVHDNIVLMGDAAHTTHFSIGSGTTLAMEDAIVLADKLQEHDDVPTALKAYETSPASHRAADAGGGLEQPDVVRERRARRPAAADRLRLLAAAPPGRRDRAPAADQPALAVRHPPRHPEPGAAQAAPARGVHAQPAAPAPPRLSPPAGTVTVRGRP